MKRNIFNPEAQTQNEEIVYLINKLNQDIKLTKIDFNNNFL